jgi:hypothetical protein
MKRKQKAISVVEKDDEKMSRIFWKKRSPEERLSAVEFLREQYCVIQGYKAPPSIIRDLHIVER